MKSKIRFHYELHINLYDANACCDTQMIQYQESFYDTDYLAARRRALEVYQNWIDVLLESIGENYYSRIQAVKSLGNFFSRSNGIEQPTFIEVRCVIDKPYKNWEYPEKKLPKVFTMFAAGTIGSNESFASNIFNKEYILYYDLHRRGRLGEGDGALKEIQENLLSLPITKTELGALLPKPKVKIKKVTE